MTPEFCFLTPDSEVPVLNLSLDKGRLETKLGQYATTSAIYLPDQTPFQRASEYRRLASQRMMAQGKEDITGRLPEGDYHVSRKIDGEFSTLAFDGKQALTVNPGGTVRVGFPATSEAAAMLGKAGVTSALIAGELYVAGEAGKRPRVHDVCRVARQPNDQNDVDSLRFAAFDIIELNGKAPHTFTETWKSIQSLFANGKHAHAVEGTFVKSPSDVQVKFEQWVENEGAEGLVVRNDSAGIFKYKPRHTIDAVVVGFTEGIDDRQGMLHDMLVALMRADGTFQLLTKVGGGFTDEQRRNFYSDLKDLVVPSEYAEVNAEHVAYEMVRPEWVVEISCLDIISQNSRGADIDKMILAWDGKQGQYTIGGRLPLANVISPQFVRRRDDKRPVPADVRVQQVSKIVEVRAIDQDSKALAAPKSELIKREVFTKVLKGQTMVRKLILWKTNKEGEGSPFPAYVTHFTDFSPNRKTSLEREIRISNSRDQIERLYAVLRDENIVKGWNKV